MVQMKSALGGIPVAQAMLRTFETLRPDDPLSRAVEMTLAGSQKDFPVLLENGAVSGVLTQERLLEALSSGGTDARVSTALHENVLAADSHEMLEAALARLESSVCKTVPVVHDNVLVGLLTLDNVGELLRIQAALKGATLKGRRAAAASAASSA